MTKPSFQLIHLVEFYLTIGIPLVYLANLVAITHSGMLEPTIDTKLIGLFLTVMGLALWLISYLHLGLAFGVLPRLQPRITRGLYHWLKHPMYLGILYTFFGLAVANASWIGLLVTLLVTTPMLYLRSIWEERRLIPG